MNYHYANLLSLLLIFLLPLYSPAQNQTIDPVKLDSFLLSCAETKADKVLIFHQGIQVAEWHNPDCDSIYMNTASMVKSWAALAVGRLIESGKITSVEDPVCDYIPDWKGGCEKEVKIKHLLSMTAGIGKKKASESVLAQKDMNAFVLGLTPELEPGTKWSYSNETVQLVSILIERASNMPSGEYMEQEVFQPLGMDSTSLFKDPAGNDILFGGCQTTVEDVSKVGLMMSQKGKVNGKAYLSESWIESCTSPGPANAYYGFLWWLDTANNNFAAMGDFGQMTIVFPDLDLVFIRQQSCSNTNPGDNMRWMGPVFLEQLKGIVIAN
ncbi:MAG: serine hydrolase [Bacteroidetes bacterium]|nr:serine hydrolase [Bacteroidota bacterium]